jgi:biofilm protein TabA
MIFDRLDQSGQYRRLHPGFDAAFDLLQSTPFAELKPGRHDVMGETLFLLLNEDEARGRDAAKLEAHRKYIDVQFIVPRAGAAAEEFGWRAAADCTNVAEKYDKEKDVVFFADRPELWFTLPPGHFVVFFPSDAHASLAGTGKLLKAVVKVAVEW